MGDNDNYIRNIVKDELYNKNLLDKIFDKENLNLKLDNYLYNSSHKIRSITEDSFKNFSETNEFDDLINNKFNEYMQNNSNIKYFINNYTDSKLDESKSKINEYCDNIINDIVFRKKIEKKYENQIKLINEKHNALEVSQSFLFFMGITGLAISFVSLLKKN